MNREHISGKYSNRMCPRESMLWFCIATDLGILISCLLNRESSTYTWDQCLKWWSHFAQNAFSFSVRPTLMWSGNKLNLNCHVLHPRGWSDKTLNVAASSISWVPPSPKKLRLCLLQSKLFFGHVCHCEIMTELMCKLCWHSTLWFVTPMSMFKQGHSTKHRDPKFNSVAWEMPKWYFRLSGASSNGPIWIYLPADKPNQYLTT